MQFDSKFLPGRWQEYYERKKRDIRVCHHLSGKPGHVSLRCVLVRLSETDDEGERGTQESVR